MRQKTRLPLRPRMCTPCAYCAEPQSHGCAWVVFEDVVMKTGIETEVETALQDLRELAADEGDEGERAYWQLLLRQYSWVRCPCCACSSRRATPYTSTT